MKSSMDWGTRWCEALQQGPSEGTRGASYRRMQGLAFFPPAVIEDIWLRKWGYRPEERNSERGEVGDWAFSLLLKGHFTACCYHNNGLQTSGGGGVRHKLSLWAARLQAQGEDSKAWREKNRKNPAADDDLYVDVCVFFCSGWFRRRIFWHRMIDWGPTLYWSQL